MLGDTFAGVQRGTRDHWRSCGGTGFDGIRSPEDFEEGAALGSVSGSPER